MSNKTHWKTLINPEYIGAYALPDGNDLTVTIDYVRKEQITGTGGKKEECTVAHLVGQKPLILNVTNSKSIARLYGAYIEDWCGKQITLHAATTKLAGEIVECIRIRPSVPRKEKPSITDARLTKALESIAKKEYTVEKLREQFVLTDAQQATVEEFTKELA